MLNVCKCLTIVAKAFFKNFNDAKEFNLALKSGKDLVYAPVIVEENKKEEKKAEETPKTEDK